jgi:hypothetical protein
MRVLNYTNNYLKQLSLFERVLVYMFPLVIFSSSFLLMDFSEIKQNKVQSQIVQLKEKIEVLEKQGSKPTMFAIVLDDFEQYAIDKKLLVDSIQIFDRSIDLKVKGHLNNLVSLIDYCETYDNYSKVKSLKMSYHEKERLNSLNIVISFDKAYIKINENEQALQEELQSLENVFVKAQVFDAVMQLNAIVGNYVLINDQWLSKEETFQGYTIASISPKHITMTKDNKKVLLELFNE